jgi:hypothetical protein
MQRLPTYIYNMKKILIYIFSLLSWALTAQDVKLSEEILLRNNDQYLLTAGFGDSIHVFMDLNGDYKIYTYNRNMELVGTKPVDFGRNRSFVLGAGTDKNCFYVFHYRFEGGNTNLYASRFNRAAKLDTTLLIHPFVGRDALPASNLIMSENNRYLLAFRSDAYFNIDLVVYDLNSFKLTLAAKIESNYSEYSQDFQQAVVSNKAEAFFVFMSDNRKARKEEAHFKVTMVNAQGVKPVAVPTSGNLINGAKFEFDNLNRKLVGAGLFGLDNVSDMQGSFYLSMNPENPEAVFSKFELFPLEFVTTATGKSEKKHRGALNDLVITDISLRRDGGIVLVAEQYKMFVRRLGTGPSFGAQPAGGWTDSQRDYYYEDLLLISMHPSGDVHWRKIMPKRQQSQDDEGRYSSYFLMKAPRSLRFIYNNEVNTSTNVNEYIVDGKGETQRRSMFDTELLKIVFELRYGLQTASNVIYFSAIRRGYLRIARLEL